MSSDKSNAKAYALLALILGLLFVGVVTSVINFSDPRDDDREAITTTGEVPPKPPGECDDDRVTLRIVAKDFMDGTSEETTAYVHIIQQGDAILGKYEQEGNWDTVTMSSNDDDSGFEYQVGEKLYLYCVISNFEEALYEYVVPCPSGTNARVSLVVWVYDTTASETDLATVVGGPTITATNYDISTSGAAASWSYKVSSGETDSTAAVQYTALILADNQFETYHTVATMKWNTSSFTVTSVSANGKNAPTTRFDDLSSIFVYADLYDTIEHSAIPNFGGDNALTLIDGFPCLFDDAGSTSDGYFEYIVSLTGLTANTQCEIGLVYQAAMSQYGTVELTEIISEVVKIQA